MQLRVQKHLVSLNKSSANLKLSILWVTIQMKP